MLRETQPFTYAILTAVFVLFVLFLYAPTFAITTLSFQGPQGGLVFPMRGVSMHWLADVFRPSRSATSTAASAARSSSASW